MIKKILPCLIFMSVAISGFAATGAHLYSDRYINIAPKTTDTIPVPDVVDVCKTVIEASSSFNGQAVANLNTPNAVVADDEAPYSWNGLTAGVQWINSVERAVKINRITKFKARLDPVKKKQQKKKNKKKKNTKTNTSKQPNQEQFQAK